MPIEYVTYNISATLDIPKKSIINDPEAIKDLLIYALRQQSPHWEYEELSVTTKTESDSTTSAALQGKES